MLTTNKRLRIYKELASLYNFKNNITPPIEHTHHIMKQAVYEDFTRTIRDHITKKETFVYEKNPNSFKVILRQ